jgi:hypothetical protein
MAIGDELEKLAKLHQSGELSDDEYARAKDAALRGPTAAGNDEEDGGLVGSLFGGDGQSLGGAANRYVSYQIVMGAIGLIVFLVIACAVLGNRGQVLPVYP